MPESFHSRDTIDRSSFIRALIAVNLENWDVGLPSSIIGPGIEVIYYAYL